MIYRQLATLYRVTRAFEALLNHCSFLLQPREPLVLGNIGAGEGAGFVRTGDDRMVFAIVNRDGELAANQGYDLIKSHAPNMAWSSATANGPSRRSGYRLHSN